MSWFDSSNWANIAKNATETAKIALKQAQKNIDKVLEIQEISRETDTSSIPAETASESGGSPRVQSRNLTPIPKLIKEETDRFFNSFDVSDSRPSSKRGSSSRNSLLEPSSEPSTLNTSKLKSPSLSPAISRVTSSASLSRLNSVNGWKTSELQAVVSDLKETSLRTTSPTPIDHSHLEIVDLQPEPSVSSTSLVPEEAPVLTFTKSNSEKLQLDVDTSVSKTDYTPEDFTDDYVNNNGPQSLPLRISHGRLEILFQDDDDKNLVDIPLDVVTSSDETTTQVQDDTAEVESSTALFNVDSDTDLHSRFSLERLSSQNEPEDQTPSVEDDKQLNSDDFVQFQTPNRESNVQREIVTQQKPAEEFSDITIKVEHMGDEGSSPPVENIELSELVTQENNEEPEAFAEEAIELLEPVVLERRDDEDRSFQLSHAADDLIETNSIPTEEPPLPSEPYIAPTYELQKEIQRLAEILASRERKLVEICSENAQLKEEKDNLSSQVADLASAHLQMESVANDRGEAMETLERKLQITADDKKSLTEQLQMAKNELTGANTSRLKSDASASQTKDLQRQLQEKELQVKELMEEGEKLSKQQFQSSSHIKKIKQRQKELETENEKLKSDLEAKVDEVGTLKSTLTLAEDLDQKSTTVIKQLSANIDRLEKDLLASRNFHDEAKAKISSMQAALDNAYKELADIHRQKAAHEGKVHETLLSTELAAKEELRQALEQQKQQLVQDQAELMERLEMLQTSLNRAESTLKRKEDSFRDELADYQQRVNEANKRNEELSQSLSQSTRPLLRQNEALQRQLAEQSNTFEQLEVSLTKRHQEAVTQLTVAQEKERTATEKLSVITGKLSALEEQLSALREEHALLSVEADEERRKVRELGEKFSSQQKELDKVKELSVVEVSALRREKQLLEHQLNLEKENVGMESRKVATLTEQLADVQKQLHASPSSANHSVNQSPLRRSDSANSSVSTLDGRWSPNSQQSSSLYDVLRNGNMSSLDTVQSSLKQKESEIHYLRSELKQLEISRQLHADEMLKLTEKSMELESVKKQLEGTAAAKEDINRRYNAMLQMYGEKVEEVQELRLDFEDMKALYKSQIVALTQKQ